MLSFPILDSSLRFSDIEVIATQATYLVNNLSERFKRSLYGKKDLMRRIFKPFFGTV